MHKIRIMKQQIKLRVDMVINQKSGSMKMEYKRVTKVVADQRIYEFVLALGFFFKRSLIVGR